MKSVHPKESKDSALEVIFDKVLGEQDENVDAYFSLTVLSNGAIVAGTAIPRQRWLELFNKQLRNGLGIEDSVDDDDADTQAEGEVPAGTNVRRYFHMRDVQVIQGSSTHLFEIWRGALVDVSGWSLGSYSEAPSD